MLIRRFNASLPMSLFTSALRSVCYAILVTTWALSGVAMGQETFTLDGPNPRVTVIDTSNDQTWVLQPDQNGFYIIDDTNLQSVPIAIKPGARDASVFISANDNIGMGTTTPQGLLDIRDNVGSSSVRFNPGNISAESMVIEEATDAANLTIKTLASNRVSLLKMTTPNGGYSFKTTATGDFILRDEGSLRNVMTIFKSTLNNNLLTLRNGNVGIGRTTPTFPIHMKSGARCTVGGVWTNASSRDLKQNIMALDSTQAAEVVAQLCPVTYQYKSEPTEDYVGFIAEDVPELLATSDRKSLAAMDVVAVLTKVVQDQQVAIERQAKEIEELKASHIKQVELVEQLARQEAMISRLADQFASISKQSPDTKNGTDQLVSAR